MIPEASLLLQLLQITTGRTNPGSVSPHNRVDWPRFQELVRRHRLSALFHRELPDNGPLPSSIREAWEDEYNRQLARTVLEQDCLNRILRALAQEGIQPIVLKGSHLSQEYYPHPALRPCDDIDLLIKPEDKLPVSLIIQEAGFSVIEETSTAMKFSRDNTEIFLEIHTNLQTPDRRNPSFEIMIVDFWNNSLPARIADQPARILSPAINLLYLAAHLSHHSFSRLIWFYDLYLIMEKENNDIDWEFLADRSRKYRCRTLIYYPFLFTGTLFGSTAPSTVLRELAPSTTKKLLIRPFLRPGLILSGKTPEKDWKALRNRFLLNDDWYLAFKKYFSS